MAEPVAPQQVDVGAIIDELAAIQPELVPPLQV